MFRKLTLEEIVLTKLLLDRERNFILYSNLHVRQDRVCCIGEFRGDELRAFGCYLTGLPFHAFSIHVETAGYEENGTYSARELLNTINLDLHLQGDTSQTGYLTLAEEDAAKIVLDGIQSEQTFLLMRLTDPSKILPPQGAIRLEGNHLADVNEFLKQVGLVAFREEELEELPHVGIFDRGKLVSMAGFHIYQELYAEIGNIGTLPEQQGKGFGKRVTSDVCRLGLERTPDLYLFVFEGNEPAKRVYETLGFETVRRYSFLQFEL